MTKMVKFSLSILYNQYQNKINTNTTEVMLNAKKKSMHLGFHEMITNQIDTTVVFCKDIFGLSTLCPNWLMIVSNGANQCILS